MSDTDLNAARFRIPLRRWIAALAIVTALAIPGCYIAVMYASETRALHFEARLSAERIAKYAYASGPLWIFHAPRVEALLQLPTDDASHSTHQVFDESGHVFSNSNTELAWPVLTVVEPITISGRPVGRIEISESLADYIPMTVVLLFFGMLLGGAILRLTYHLPLRALDRTLDMLKQSRDEAQAASHSKSEFLANMSHELRTPLNAVIGFSEMLSFEVFGPLGSAKYKDYATNVVTSARYLLSIINEMLDLAKAESGKMELEQDEVSIPDIVNQSVQLTATAAAARHVAVEVNLAESLPLITGDRQRLVQILVNLLSNSVKFTEPGGAIAIEAAYDGPQAVRLSVSDTGIGMREEDIPKALRPFEQVAGSVAHIRRFGGTGLGLPIARKLAELHGGSLHLVSRLGVGTVASVILPVGERAHTPRASADSGSSARVDAELGAGLGRAEKGVAAIAPDVAAGAAADLAPGDLTAKVVLGAVGVQRNLRAVEHQQQFGLFGVETREQPIEGGKAGLALEDLEDTVEAGAQLDAARGRLCKP